MVSYYNHFAMYPKNHSGNLSYSATSGWYPSNYQHQPPHAQFIGDGESSPQPMYYPHPHVFHPQSSPDWSGHENFPTPPQTTLLPHGPSPGSGGAGSGGAGAGGGLGGGGVGGGIGLNLAGPGANHLHHHHHHHHSSNSSGSGGGAGGGGGGGSNNAGNNGHNDHLADGLHSIPSPPITVSGSDMSSPGAPTGSASPQITPRPTPVKSPYEWMKKQSYQSQPNPGKTRTKDKYRVVYTDQQRLELEKEFHYTRYITIRRKSELAQNLQLSERQVKIWFQNRRAKDRKQKKKAESGSAGTGGTGGVGPGSIGGGIIGGGAGGVGGSGAGGGGLGMVGGPHHHHHHHHLGPQSLVAHSQSAAQNHPHSLLVDTKPKLEPSLHLSHLHQMSAMSMGMGSMGLHHPAHHHLHPHLGVPTASQHLNSVQGGPGSQVPTSLSIM